MSDVHHLLQFIICISKKNKFSGCQFVVIRKTNLLLFSVWVTKCILFFFYSPSELWAEWHFKTTF